MNEPTLRYTSKFVAIEDAAKIAGVTSREIKAYIEDGSISASSSGRVELEIMLNFMLTGRRARPDIIDRLEKDKAEAEAKKRNKERLKSVTSRIKKLEKQVDLGGHQMDKYHPVIAKNRQMSGVMNF